MKIRLDKNDRLFSHEIKLLAGGKCEYCGKEGNQCSHFHSRRKFSTRYDTDNACWACFSCHKYFEEHPNIHSEFFEKRLGSKKYEELNIRAMAIVKRTRLNEEAINQNLKMRIRILSEL